MGENQKKISRSVVMHERILKGWNNVEAQLNTQMRAEGNFKGAEEERHVFVMRRQQADRNQLLLYIIL